MNVENEIKALIKRLYKHPSASKEAEGVLVLFAVGSCFVAIGTSADNLYLTLGWDIIAFVEDGVSYSYIIVSKEGREVLKLLQNKPETIPTSTRYQSVQHTIAETQQALDYLRLLAQDETILYPVVDCKVTVEGVGFIRELRLSSISISKEEISLCIDNQEVIEVVKGREWNFHLFVLQLLSAVAKILKGQFSHMKYLVQYPQAAAKEQKLVNTKIYEVFLKTKREKPFMDIVVVNIGSHYLTFDDDAIWVSAMNGVLRYDCNTFGVRGKTCAVLNLPQVDFLLSKEIKIAVIQAEESCLLFQMGLKESTLLNFKANRQIVYYDVVIRKRMGGDYIISACCNDNPLPETPISNVVGGYYHKLPECLEKRAILSAVAHQSYDGQVSTIWNI
jgi:hypothetical protein